MTPPPQSSSAPPATDHPPHAPEVPPAQHDPAPSRDQKLTIGALIYAAALASMLLLAKLPSPVRSFLLREIYGTPREYLLLALGALGALVFALGAVREIGPRRLELAWTFVRRLGPAAVLGAGALALPPLGSIALFYYLNEIGVWLRSHGSSGVAIYAVAFAILAGLAVLPTYASAILGGWAFGPAIGFPAALCGYLGGALIGYYVGRAGSGDRVDRIIKEKPKWEAVRHSLVGCGFLRTLLIVTLVRLPPNSPFALTNLVLSSVKTNVFAYALGTLLGMAPRTGVVLYIASRFAGMSATDAADKKPVWLLVVGAILAIAVLVVIGKIANKALHQVTRSSRPPASPLA